MASPLELVRPRRTLHTAIDSIPRKIENIVNLANSLHKPTTVTHELLPVRGAEVSEEEKNQALAVLQKYYKEKRFQLGRSDFKSSSVHVSANVQDIFGLDSRIINHDGSDLVSELISPIIKAFHGGAMKESAIDLRRLKINGSTNTNK